MEYLPLDKCWSSKDLKKFEIPCVERSVGKKMFISWSCSNRQVSIFHAFSELLLVIIETCIIKWKKEKKERVKEEEKIVN
jgi:hypothetical protein